MSSKTGYGNSSLECEVSANWHNGGASWHNGGANWHITGIDIRRDSREAKRARNKSTKLVRRARKAEATEVAKPKKATNNKAAKTGRHAKSYRKYHWKTPELPDYEPEEINQEVRRDISDEEHEDYINHDFHLTCKSGKYCMNEKHPDDVLIPDHHPDYGQEFYIKDCSSKYEYCPTCSYYMDGTHMFSVSTVESDTEIHYDFILKPNQYVLVKRKKIYEAEWQYGIYYGLEYQSTAFEFEIYDNKPVLSDNEEVTYENPNDIYSERKIVSDEYKIIRYEELLNILNKKNKSIPLSDGYSIRMNHWNYIYIWCKVYDTFNDSYSYSYSDSESDSAL